MKKILSTFAMAVVAMTALAQQNQQYFRVEFTKPMTAFTNGGKTDGVVSATMKEDYVYCNPEHEYLDFNATNNPMKFDNSTHNFNENSYYYLTYKFQTQGSTIADANGYAAEEHVSRYMCDNIKKITAYSIPVEKVTMLDSTATHDITFIGNGKTYKGAEFTFNRMPRNVAELKTLIDPNNDGSRVGCENPLYVAAVMYLIWPRLLDCSQDCRDMLDYMYGKHYSQLNTTGISNQSFQNLCIGQFQKTNGYYDHYQLFQHFAGATPMNQYKPNGKDHGVVGPFKVRVVWDNQTPTQPLSNPKCTLAKMLLMPNPDATTKDEISFEDPTAHVVYCRSTNKTGWFFHMNEKTYYAKGKDMYDDDF